MSENKPNILIIMSDQHNKRVMGCAGDSIIRTPNLDRLAENGVRFTDCYTPAPLCVPARMSFMSSRSPSKNRVWTNAHSLNSAIPTWAHALDMAGYETALVGRMHFIGQDQRHGFQSRPCGEPQFGYNFGQGGKVFADVTPQMTGQHRDIAMTSGKGIGPYEIFDEQVTDAALKYLDQHVDTDSPFAAVVGYLLPHCPFIGDPDLFDYYYDQLDITPVTEEEMNSLPESIRDSVSVREFNVPVPPENIRSARAAYYAMVEKMDMLIGTILRKLEDTGLDENTLVIYTSDHGELQNEHGLWAKSFFYEGSAGVPLICSCPTRFQSGITSSAVTSLMDIGPTVVDIAGGEKMKNVDGHSLLPFLKGETPESWMNETISELVVENGVECAGKMLRKDNWKLWYYSNNTPPVLFNLENDPDELNDLGTDDSYASIRDELLSQLMKDWYPELIVTESKMQHTDFRDMMQWGIKFTPDHEDMNEILVKEQKFIKKP